VEPNAPGFPQSVNRRAAARAVGRADAGPRGAANLIETDRTLVLKALFVHSRESHNRHHFYEVRRLDACAVQYDPLD